MGVEAEAGGVLSSHEEKEFRRQKAEADRERQRAAAFALQKGLSRKKYVTWGVLSLLVVFVLYAVSGLFSAVHLEVGDHPVFGPSTAKVEFVVFGDFQCPFTKKFFLGAYQKVVDEYKDRIKIAFRPMPTNRHTNDKLSAQAAYCANDQGKFWEYAKLVFERQGQADTLSLVKYATELGLDTQKFSNCLQGGTYKKKVNEDYKAGRRLGVAVTPTVYVNEYPLAGDLPFEEYKKLIEWAESQSSP